MFPCTYFLKSLAVLHVQSLLLQPVFSDGPETPSVENHVTVVHKTWKITSNQPEFIPRNWWTHVFRKDRDWERCIQEDKVWHHEMFHNTNMGKHSISVFDLRKSIAIILAKHGRCNNEVTLTIIFKNHFMPSRFHGFCFVRPGTWPATGDLLKNAEQEVAPQNATLSLLFSRLLFILWVTAEKSLRSQKSSPRTKVSEVWAHEWPGSRHVII